jgi:hypothetical protein
LMPPLLQLPLHAAPVSLFATSAKANSQVTTTRHPSHVTRHTSHVTRHTYTSHVTRHTSHVTRHTSHVTRHRCIACFTMLPLLSSAADKISAAALAAAAPAPAATASHYRYRLS